MRPKCLACCTNELITVFEVPNTPVKPLLTINISMVMAITLGLGAEGSVR